jgi:hypothetical protein
MSDEVVDVVQEDADALAAAMAGYNSKARTEEVPAAASAEQPSETQPVVAAEAPADAEPEQAIETTETPEPRAEGSGFGNQGTFRPDARPQAVRRDREH